MLNVCNVSSSWTDIVYNKWEGTGNHDQRYPRCFSVLLDDWLPGLALFPSPSLVCGGVAEGLFSIAKPPQAFPGAFVKHRSKGGQ